MNLAIIGSRDFNNYKLLERIIDEYNIHYNFDTIISGGAKGADSLGEQYAKENDIPLVKYLPDWEKYGKDAGFIRNKDIIENSDYIIAFWDEISKGTLHSINLARKQNKPCTVIYYNKIDELF